ncbi:MAG TPA: 30S ribosomal protein S2 [Armatimonadota bacterium]|nr:30S ribosomal protein S2 [Armatimonadota bacterium]
MPHISMKELLEAGVHFGHQTRRWNPKMKRYIFGARNGIYIIDLHQTARLFDDAYNFLHRIASGNGNILFVGTKKQAQDAVRESALRCRQFYVNQRWLGGMLTNYDTIRRRIQRLREIEREEADGTLARRTKLEQARIMEQKNKLERNLGGIKDMNGLPQAIVIIDLKKEHIAVREAHRLGIPVVALVDTNCDPDEASYVVPGNDDAIRAVRLITSRLADAICEAKSISTQGEEGISDETGLEMGAETEEEDGFEGGEDESQDLVDEEGDDTVADDAELEDEVETSPTAA